MTHQNQKETKSKGNQGELRASGTSHCSGAAPMRPVHLPPCAHCPLSVRALPPCALPLTCALPSPVRAPRPCALPPRALPRYLCAPNPRALPPYLCAPLLWSFLTRPGGFAGQSGKESADGSGRVGSPAPRREGACVGPRTPRGGSGISGRKGSRCDASGSGSGSAVPPPGARSSRALCRGRGLSVNRRPVSVESRSENASGLLGLLHLLPRILRVLGAASAVFCSSFAPRPYAWERDEGAILATPGISNQRSSFDQIEANVALLTS